MFNHPGSSLRRLVSPEQFEQLCCLWEQTAEEIKAKLVTEALFINRDNQPKERLRLLLDPNISALLVGRLSDRLDYQIIIILSPQAITAYLAAHSLALPKRLKSVQTQPSVFADFTLQLLEILTPQPSSLLEPTIEDFPYQYQKRILKQLAWQIHRNWHDLAIIELTLEPVRKILQVDRLLIYQLKNDHYHVNTVTHETLADPHVPSILGFQDENQGTSECLEKYRHGFTLAVNYVPTDPQLNERMRSLMQQLQVQAVLAIPIMVLGELWGFVIAHQCSAPRQWQNGEQMFLGQVAQYLAIAIGQTRLKQQSQRTQAVQMTARLKRDFISNISHELRTPLTHIIGLSGTLLHWSNQKLLPADKQHHYLELIQNSGRQLLEMIDNILDFSQMKEGKTRLHLNEFSIVELCHRVLNRVEGSAKRQQICLKLNIRVEPNGERCWGDQERIQQILLQLLDNAIKFTPAGKTVTLTVWRDEQMVFQVEDTGIGVSPEQLPLAFEMFEQLEHSRQRIHSGTGLGLALTKQLIELHQGTIDVQSIPGKGSLFTVRLPV